MNYVHRLSIIKDSISKSKLCLIGEYGLKRKYTAIGGVSRPRVAVFFNTVFIIIIFLKKPLRTYFMT